MERQIVLSLLIVLLLIKRQHYQTKIIKPAFIGSAILILLPLLWYAKHDSSLGRLHIWRLSLQLWLQQNFFSGLGSNAYNPAYNHLQATYFSSRSLYTKAAMLANDGYFASNEYLQFGIEYGWWYTLLLLLIFSVYTAFLFAAWRQKLNVLQLFYTCLQLPMFIASWVAHPWHYYASIACTVLLMLLLLVEELSKSVLSNSKTKKWCYAIFTAFTLLYCLACFRFEKTKNTALTKAKNEWQWGNKGEAIILFESICATHPDWQPHNETFAYYLWAMGNTQKAIDKLERHHKHHCNQRLHQMLGDWYLEKKSRYEAMHHYHKSLFITPHLIESRIKLAEAYLAFSNTDSAVYWANQALIFPRKVYSPKIEQLEKKAAQILKQQ